MGFTASPVLPSLAQLQGKPRHRTGSQALGFPLMASLPTADANDVNPLNKRGGGKRESRKGQSLAKEEFTAS